MWNCRGKRQRQIRGIAACRLAGTKISHQTSSDRSSAAMEYLQRLMSPTGHPSRVPRPLPQPPPRHSGVRTAPVCSNVQTPASGVPPRSLFSACSLWTASRRDLQCDLSEAESSGSSGSSSSTAMKTRRCSCTRDWAAGRRSLLVAVLAMIRRWP
jgi:hypothetical protein